MATKHRNLSQLNSPLPSAEEMKFGIVVAEWNPEVTEGLLSGAVHTLRSAGCPEHNIQIKYVPGTFELSLGAQFFAEYTDVDAVIVLGCVIQGDTRHFDFICQGVTQALSKLMEVIKNISEGHFDERMPVDEFSDNEIMQVGAAVNNMAEKLEEVETSRQHFVSNVSHELKTPLSSIKVLSESILLDSEAPKETYVEFLRDINSEVDRMTEIINDLLTLVRLDQKEIPVTFKSESLNAVIEDIIKRLRPLADSKNIDFEYTAVKEVSAEIDRTKLSLAVSNLVENGIKYTDDGGMVKIVLDCDHQNAFITVSDTGIGMAEEELSKIFQRFYRIDKTRNRETGGTGLGLSITHSTILMHNGSIKVTSRENEGTTFVVRIPLAHNL